MRSKNRGFIEISLITVLVVFVSLVLVFAKWEQGQVTKRTANKAAETFKQVISASMAYRQDNGAFPVNTAQLVPNYLSAQAQTNPWGNPITVTQSGANNVVISTVALDTINAGYMAMEIPLATVTAGTTVSATYGKPGSEPALASLLKKDGSTPLTGDWDVNGHGITSVSDITVNGMPNRTVVQGLNYSTIVTNAGTVSKLTCPAGYNFHVFVTPVAMNYNGQPFTSFGGYEARYNDLGWGIQAYVRVLAKDSGTGQITWIVPNWNAALVKVDMSCGK